MMRRIGKISAVGAIALMLAGGSLSASARNQGVPNAKPDQNRRPLNYPVLFPYPTNTNGYEEFVQAVDLIMDSSTSESLNSDPKPKLTIKRRVLDDPAVAKALQLIRVGLNKPIFSPRTNIDESTRFTELAYFRQLGRLLVAEQYIAFADGHVDAAIDSLRVGLAFGNSVQTDCLINGLVGVAIEKMALNEFIRHLDQLSIYHCDDVRRLVEDFLSIENPVTRLMALEKVNALKILDAKRSQPNGLLDWLGTMVGSDEAGNPDADLLAVQDYLKTNPSDVSALIDDARDRINDLYNQVLPNIGLPAAQRKPFATNNTSAPDAAIARLIMPNTQLILERYAADRDQLRMVGIHALIHRYRWDHDALPNSLKELRAPKLLTDASTGDEVVYTRAGDGYSLSILKPASRTETGR